MKPYKSDDATWFYILFLCGIVYGTILSGCAGEYNEIEPDRVVAAPANAGSAIYVAMTELGINHLPQVYWYGNKMDCNSGNGWMHEGFCIDGAFWPWADQIAVSITRGAPIHDTPVAHELCHVIEYQRTGDPDSDHKGECFVNRLDPLNEKLASLGY